MFYPERSARSFAFVFVSRARTAERGVHLLSRRSARTHANRNGAQRAGTDAAEWNGARRTATESRMQRASDEAKSKQRWRSSTGTSCEEIPPKDPKAFVSLSRRNFFCCVLERAWHDCCTSNSFMLPLKTQFQLRRKSLLAECVSGANGKIG